ncbi:MAG: type I polyketide synthase [Planctomycetes bacterium]|nr:type I polyketide synthase [Planctomycetota bacterium]
MNNIKHSPGVTDHSFFSPIAIVSAGCVFAGSPNLESLWQLVASGQNASSEVPPGRWVLDPSNLCANSMAEVDKVHTIKGFFAEVPERNPEVYPLPLEVLQKLDAGSLFALEAASQALKGKIANLDRQRVGVILGHIALPTEGACKLNLQVLGKALFEAAGLPIPKECQGIEPSWLSQPAALPANLISTAFNLGGPCFTLDAACASSFYALKLASDALYHRRADAVLAGGVSGADSLYTHMGFSQLRALSMSGNCRPFDHRGDGLMVGEGAGIFLLKRLQDAIEAKDQILGVIRGIGLSNDIGGGLLAPNSEGQLRAMRAAYQQSGLKPSDIDLIECHAAGTPVGDGVEFSSMAELWKSESYRVNQCVIGSVKSNVGHVLTAAGGAGLAKVLAGLSHQQLPPTAGFETSSSSVKMDSSAFRVLKTVEAWKRRRDDIPRRAALSGFGFGGINAHVLVEEWIGQKLQVAEPQAEHGPLAVISVAARNSGDLGTEPFFQRAIGIGKVEVEPLANSWDVQSSKALAADLPHGTLLKGRPKKTVDLPVDAFRIPPRELEQMLPQQGLALDTAREALESVKFKEGDFQRMGVFLGVGLDLNTTNYHLRWWWLSKNQNPEYADAAGPALNADRTMGALASIAASRIAREYRVGGVAFTIAADENSGLRALEIAWDSLASFQIDSALVGAVDFCLDPRMIVPLAKEARLTETVNHGALAQGHTGLLPSDGSAVLVLKRLEDAEKSGDNILAVLRGVGTFKDPVNKGKSDKACRTAMESAYLSSGIHPATIQYLESNSSGVEQEDAAEARALGDFFFPRQVSGQAVLHCARFQLGWSGAATGLQSLAKACLCLSQKVLPGNSLEQTEIDRRYDDARFLSENFSPTPWIRNREDGPRRAGVNSLGSDGTWFHILIEEAEWENNSIPPNLVASAFSEALFVIHGKDVSSLESNLLLLKKFALEDNSPSLLSLAKDWYEKNLALADSPLALAFVVFNLAELPLIIEAGLKTLRGEPIDSSITDRLFYSSRPLGHDGKVAMVFPGSGADFSSMAADLSLRWPHTHLNYDKKSLKLRAQILPELYWHGRPFRQPLPHERIMAQVSFGCTTAEIMRLSRIKTDSVLGYSLGESTALVAMGYWADRDGLWHALEGSTLFKEDLVGKRQAIALSWGLEPGRVPDWLVGLVEKSPEDIEKHLDEFDRVYLLIINSPNECVIGGDAIQVKKLVKQLNCRLFPLSTETAAVHCEAARPIADAYRRFHLLPTTPMATPYIYSASFGSAYEVTKEAASEAITGLALSTMDFNKIVETAYNDGARIFLEMGPGSSCSRIITNILKGRPHFARSLSTMRGSQYLGFLKTIAALVSERVFLDLSFLFDSVQVTHEKGARVSLITGSSGFALNTRHSNRKSPQIVSKHAAEETIPFMEDENVLQLHGIGQAVNINQSAMEAHAAYLKLSQSTLGQMTALIEFQNQMLQSVSIGDKESNRFSEDVFETAKSYIPIEDLPVPPRSLDRNACLHYARGNIAGVLGSMYAEIDAYPTRVRLPDEPLMLVDRILAIEGEPCSMGSGRIITEHDVLPDAWYLDHGRIPTCIAVESGQADLFLSGFLGIDHKTKGLAVYRLLDAEVTFHRSLPVAGEVIHYDIRIDRFFRHNDTYLFRFWYDATVNGEPLMAMREGCAGFFTEEALAAGKGIVISANADKKEEVISTPPLLSMVKESFSEEQLDALRNGDLAACFGGQFANLPIKDPATLPGGKMRLVHRVPLLEPAGGPAGLGRILGEADIHPDDWFLTCHFVDDQVMPGTLMYECCLHTLRIFLYRMGWVGEKSNVAFEPVPGVTGKLRCRGQVTATTKKVTYEVLIRERGYRPEPYTIVDAYMYADGKNVVEIKSMSLRMTGWSKESVEAIWSRGISGAMKAPRFDNASIMAFAIGNPSEAFGDAYKVFDVERKIARLPGPPYKFLDRIMEVNCEPWKMVAGGEIVAEYDVPPDEWYFQSERQAAMPFAVLLEIALQPCGWLAAYLGSALTSQEDLSFRNLGGKAVYLEPVFADAGTLSIKVKITRVSSSAGMVVQSYLFDVICKGKSIYKGDTTFGFFSKEALANQVGVRGASLWNVEKYARVDALISTEPPFPDDFLRMLDRVEYLEEKGGVNGLGYIRGIKQVNPNDWFFKAHFYQDPVWPGSLGLEAMIQLMKILAKDFWPDVDTFLPIVSPEPHIWIYRGQVIPHNSTVIVEANITSRDDSSGLMVADGKLSVDGLIIYEMKDFRLRAWKS